MTLLEMSAQYADSAALIRARICELRADERLAEDPAAAGRLRRRINELTPRQQQMLSMRFEQNMSVTEIARELGLNCSTVSRTLRRAQERLRRCLQYAL